MRSLHPNETDMRALQAFLMGLLMLAFAGAASAANVSCEQIPTGACSSAIPAEHCPGAPAALDCAAHCGSMCAAVTAMPTASDAPRPARESAVSFPVPFLTGVLNRPEPPPPRG